MPRMKIFTYLLAAACCVPAFADDGAAVTPYRPSVSSPAQLPAPGQLELEMGGLHARTNDDRRGSLPYQLKLAFSDQWGVLLGGEGYVSSREDGSRASGFGDTSMTLKHAFLIDDATAFGLEFTSTIPTAKDSIGSGKADYTLNGIFSKDLGNIHMDMNLNATRIGAPGSGEGRMQTGISSSFSMPIAEKWGATAELSGTHQHGVPGTAQCLTALTYSPDKRMAIDFGVLRGLNHASPDWGLFAGIVVPIANLW